jgi:hypothetical protein
MRFAILANIAMAALTIGLPMTANGLSILKSGPDSCGAWTQERANGSTKSFMMQAWILGFVSGIVYAEATGKTDPLGGIDAFGVFAWIDQYCQAHPLDDVAIAARELAGEVQHRAGGK